MLVAGLNPQNTGWFDPQVDTQAPEVEDYEAT
jgi:hypothetical protein